MSQQLQITGGAKVRSLEGVITGSTGVLGSLPINGSNGIPQLDVNGKILVSQLPNSVMEYLGTWNAATNTPTLANGTGNAGDVYLCNVAGTTNFGAGPITFYVGDQVIYSGTIWQRASGATGSVTSVAVTETGDALTITGSPITTSGTINIGFAGTSAQYVAGDGTLITFPTFSGFVPYTGATGPVNLGAYDLTVNELTIGKGTNGLSNNTALGHQALFHITTGNYNTGVGHESLHNTSSGQYNTALGQSSLFTNTTGSQNTAIGLNALLYNTSGGSNVVVGLDAMQHNASGSSNTALGYNAGSHITGGTTPNTTASNGIYIGRDSKAKLDGQSNEIVIGYNAIGNGSNTVTIGNSSITNNYFTGSINGNSFVKSGGTSSQFLKADGSVDSTIYVPTSRTLTINGTTYDLSADRSWTITAGVSGSGTTNYIPKFTGSTSIGNSTLQEVSSGRLQLGSSSISNAEFDLVSNNATSFTLYEGYSYTSIQSYNGAAFTIVNSRSGISTDLMNYDYTSKALSFQTNGNNTRLNITSSGNIGIGNTNDTYKLDVSGTGRFTGQLTLGSTITDGTNVFTLPYDTGFLALTSDIPTDYVNLTSNQTIGGQKTFSNATIFSSKALFNGNGLTIKYGAGYNADPGTSSFVINKLTSLSKNQISLVDGDTGNYLNLNWGNTSSREYNFPTATSGTLALISDIPSLTGYISGSGVSGRIPYFNGTTTQTSTSNLTWDNTGNFISTSGVYVFNNTTNAYMLTSNGDDIGSVFNVSTTRWGLGYSLSPSTLATAALSWDNTGKVSIGNTNSTYNLDVTGTGRFTGRINATGASTNGILISAASAAVTIPTTGLSFNTGYSVGYINNYSSAGSLVDLYYGASAHIFGNSSERMRITSGGNLLINTTTNAATGWKLQSNGIISTLGTDAGLVYADRNTTTTQYYFYATSGLTYFFNSGNIAQINMSNGAYTALSDINKKKDFEYSTIGLNAILGLKPTLYRMKTDNEETEKQLGFIAQEVKEFIPQAYVESGEGEDKFIGLQDRPIIAALVNAIKELNDKIEKLENK